MDWGRSDSKNVQQAQQGAPCNCARRQIIWPRERDEYPISFGAPEWTLCPRAAPQGVEMGLVASKACGPGLVDVAARVVPIGVLS